ncbi:plasmid stabilization protein [Betaproteobacteria bacterium]|nr:plasmid stabilization protein [Betaproteobacteria bacterium]GHT98163.1 plasmid stabilization protein [Betaproteobacteria bacterium]GHU08717.1 plasmid stabilization protein [Betaproteobacteria bacterium]GHU21171.1 plasmid stabilization protein [Betaproteobacteria bacterium]GHU25861.1 plasmid stabilization protein [Betaproteobacteria bacterium]
MSFAVEFASSAREDLLRLYEYLLDRAQTLEDLELAERALEAIETAIDVHLSRTPFIYRKAASGNGLRRELVVPFGATGYVVLYEVVDPSKVMVLAVRHQREEDYHY